ncbi:hypothetical protein JCM17960_19210 [Magnetospira thiophila]
MNRVLIKTYVLPEEREAIREKAARLDLTVSEFVRKVATGARIPVPQNDAEIRELIRFRADLARLGNLLKLALDDPGWIAPDAPDLDVEALIRHIAASKDLLRRKIEAL